MGLGFGLIAATGSWVSKTAKEACEAAAVPSLRKYGSVNSGNSGSPISMLPMLWKNWGRIKTHTHRCEDRQALEQLSTQRRVGRILIDNWAFGQRGGVWINKSGKSIEDAQRDSSGLGMERLLITHVPRFRRILIRLTEGVLFAAYATLRAYRRRKRLSGVRHIVESLGSDFDGVTAFDESEVSAMRADAAFAALADRRPAFKLAEGHHCRRVEAMDVHRIELSGFNDTMPERLKAYSLLHEIISWKLHVFIPADRIGAGIITKVLEHDPFEWGTEREAE
ncbi:strawberry notch-like NTP hydrolase domain-containing protein [Bradyrhizobium sp. DASA03120]|uniref:strawberry notch-like NTP hydrolase domain-containing protein n=1 Tax=Bradyrhizobium sp. SMVTL-02 TaxID=3395917 RepID=UPI003F6EA4AC